MVVGKVGVIVVVEVGWWGMRGCIGGVVVVMLWC